LFHEGRNESLLKLIVENYKHEWYFGDKKMPHETTSMPAGTLLEVDRVYVRTINKRATSEEEDYDSVTFKVIDHPSKKKVRFWVKLDDVNTIEYEIPPDVTASKDQAREAAKIRQKKLTKELCRNHVVSSFYDGGSSKPTWWSQDLKKTFDALAKEYKNRHRPLEEVRIQKLMENDKAEAKHRFDTGMIVMPMGLAERFKKLTFEEYWAEEGSLSWTRNRGVNDRVYATDYFIPYEFLYSSHPTSFKQLASGERLRQFRGERLDTSHRGGFSYTRIDYSDMYVNVITNADDTEILRVEAGIDEKVAP
jgi:hypothetical protein